LTPSVSRAIPALDARIGKRVGRSAALTFAVALLVAGFVGSARADRTLRTHTAGAIGEPCSRAIAEKLEIDRVAGVLCGAFLGTGSRAMAVITTTGNCLPFLGWDMFALRGGSWKRLNLPAHGGLTYVPLKAAGNDLRETLPIRRRGDMLCNPTGGTQTRLWHWNGTEFAPGPWSYARTKARPSPPREVVYTSPSRNIQCSMTDSARVASVSCQTFEPSATVSMDGTGRLTRICQHEGCAGNAGEGAKYIVIAYGHSVTVGRFRCLSETSGMTCVVSSTGRGFQLSKSGIRRVG
jgi:hypothetical protein